MIKKVHHLKLDENFADAVLNGEKPFEVRYNDRGYQKGDEIVFRVVDNLKLDIHHPLNDELFVITYVLNGWGIEDRYVVLGIRKVEKK